MTHKHTPAPWHVGDANPYFLRKVYDGDGRLVANCARIYKRTGDEEEANALLIASAPVLLAALEEIAAYPGDPYEVSEIQSIAKLAIAKARGES